MEYTDPQLVKEKTLKVNQWKCCRTTNSHPLDKVVR